MSWYKISLECKGKGQARKEELRELVITDVPRCTGYADAMQTIETWRRTPASARLSIRRSLLSLTSE